MPYSSLKFFASADPTYVEAEFKYTIYPPRGIVIRLGRQQMYFPDLSPYTYRALRDPNKYLNIGWLDEHHPFPTGMVDDAIRRKLFTLCASPLAKTRGWHHCPFCKTQPATAILSDQKLDLGSAEIEVRGPAGMVFRSPDLIYHYVEAHQYRPPDVFIQAVDSV